MKASTRALMISFAGVAGVLTSGCATTRNTSCMKQDGFNIGLVGVSKSRFDTDCHRGQITQQMMNMGPNERAAAMAIEEASDPKFAAGAKATRDALANKGQTIYRVRRNADGSATLIGDTVITVGTSMEKNGSASAAESRSATASPLPPGP